LEGLGGGAETLKNRKYPWDIVFKRSLRDLSKLLSQMSHLPEWRRVRVERGGGGGWNRNGTFFSEVFPEKCPISVQGREGGGWRVGFEV